MRTTARCLPLVFLLVAGAWLPGRVSADTVWINLDAAGDWFQASNWFPAIFPAESDDAVINNGGEARADIATATGLLFEPRRLQVGHNGGTGAIINQGVEMRIGTSVNIGTVQDAIGSAQVTSLGVATWTDISQPISIGTDLRVGRNISQDDVVSMATGTLSIDRANSIGIGGDLDVGQTAHGGSPTTGGNAIGGGNAVIRDIVGAITVLNSVEVGRTSSVAGNVAQGNGTLSIERAGALAIAVDLSVGQVSGAGQATGTGLATIRNIPAITIGGNIDVGRAGGSTTNVNTGNGTATISDAAVGVGFADPLLPGNVNVGRAIFAGASDADAVGMLTLERASLQVAGRIIVGQLSGGPGKVTSSASGTLKLVDSLANTPALDVGTKLNGAVGTVAGSVQLTSSLMDVTGAMTLGNGSTLIVDLGGTTRATGGGGGAGKYGAVNSSTAILGGVFQANLVNGFLPGLGDTFSVLTFASRVGDFSSYLGLNIGGHLALEPRFVAGGLDLRAVSALTGDVNLDGIVGIFDVNAVSANWNTAGPQGDANGDGIVNVFDVNVISANWGAIGGGAVSVPEPASLVLASIAILALGCKLRRQNQG